LSGLNVQHSKSAAHRFAVEFQCSMEVNSNKFLACWLKNSLQLRSKWPTFSISIKQHWHTGSSTTAYNLAY